MLFIWYTLALNTLHNDNFHCAATAILGNKSAQNSDEMSLDVKMLRRNTRNISVELNHLMNILAEEHLQKYHRNYRIKKAMKSLITTECLALLKADCKLGFFLLDNECKNKFPYSNKYVRSTWIFLVDLLEYDPNKT